MTRTRACRPAPRHLLPVAAVVVAVALTAGTAPGTALAAAAPQRWQVAHVDPLPASETWTSVAAIARDDVWAGGLQPYDPEEDFGRPSVGHWDGHEWRTTQLSISDETSRTAVAAVPPADPADPSDDGAAWAAWSTGTAVPDGRVARWRGVAWFGAPSKGLAPYRGGLAATPGRAWALGTYHSVAYLQDRATSWVRSRAIEKGRLLDLAARTKNDVWVVGDSHEGPFVHAPAEWQPIAAHWDGTRWTRTKLPVSGCHLVSVTVPGPGDAWALCTPNVSGHQRVLRWQDGAWRVVDSPETVGGTDVAASSDGQAWIASGRSVDHWDGRAWTVTMLPLPAPPARYHRADARAVAWVPGTTAGAYAVGDTGLAGDFDDFRPVDATVWRTR